jgi:NADH-quinone oxidoreductase subunit N
MTLPAFDLRLLWPELVVAVGAIGLMLWGSRGGRTRAVRAAGVLVLAAAAWLVLAIGPAGEGVGAMYVRDGLTVVLQVTALFAALAAAALAGGYIERAALAAGEFYALILIATLGAMVMAAARDLILVFLGLETLSIPLYVLAAFAREDRRSQEAGMKYFLLGAFSTAFFLYGIALIFGASGSTALSAVASAQPSLLLHIGTGLLLVGLGFKAAIVPFHAWAPDVYEGAPLPVTAYMAVIAKVGAFAALLRVIPAVIGASRGEWVTVVGLLSVLTMVLGNFAALLQTGVKRLLAYSSIAHAGFMLIGIAAGTAPGAGAVAFYLIAYALMTLGAFGVVFMLERGGEEADQIEDLTGLASRSPALAAAMAVFMVSLAGLPPTAGFVAKFYVFTAALDAGQTALAVIGVLTSVVSAYFYLRIAYTMFTGEPRPDVAFVGGRWVSAAIMLSAVGVLALGVFPAPITTFARQVAQILR